MEAYSTANLGLRDLADCWYMESVKTSLVVACKVALEVSKLPLVHSQCETDFLHSYCFGSGYSFLYTHCCYTDR